MQSLPYVVVTEEHVARIYDVRLVLFITFVESDFELGVLALLDGL
jgi:hypothetical protein